jgi:hypothetical protein
VVLVLNWLSVLVPIKICFINVIHFWGELTVEMFMMIVFTIGFQIKRF